MKFGQIIVIPFVMVGCPALAQSNSEIAGKLTPEVHRCEAAPENGGTLQQAICYKDEVERQDKKLNEVWKHATVEMPEGRLKSLRRSESQWISERDQECRREGNFNINSTAAYMYNVCMAREDIRRTIWLEDGANGPFVIPKQSGA